MSYIENALVGNRISAVLVDSEVTCIMLANGTQITIRGLMVVEPLPGCMPAMESRGVASTWPA